MERDGSIGVNDFAAFWRAIYPEAWPIGYLLRSAGVEHWVRFHSLPLSKRYPETDEERALLLGRQNELAVAVLSEGSTCWLVQSCWVTPEGYTEHADEAEAFRETREYPLQQAFTFCEDDDEPVSVWNVMATSTSWKRGAFDATLLRIADWQAAPTLWVSAKDGAVFAPYDGGVDLFLPAAAKVDELRSTYADWLPPTPDGL